MEEHLDAHANEKSLPDRNESVLSQQDIRALTLMCTEFLFFCSKLVGKSNPTLGAMLTYVRDEVASKGIDET